MTELFLVCIQNQLIWIFDIDLGIDIGIAHDIVIDIDVIMETKLFHDTNCLSV